MRTTRRDLFRRLTRGACAASAGALLLTGLLVGPAAAAPDPLRGVDAATLEGVSAVLAHLGKDRTAGAHRDEQGRRVVTVTDAAAARLIEAKGGIAKVVKYSDAYFESVTNDLYQHARIPGTSWGVDPRTNSVTVTLDETVTGGNLTAVEAVTKRYPADAITFERVPGVFESSDAIMRAGMGVATSSTGSVHCTAGFNVAHKTTGTKYMTIAGHCLGASVDWYSTAFNGYLGNRHIWSFPGNDYGLIRYNNSNVSPYGVVYVNADNVPQITTSRYAEIDEPVKRAGAISDDLIGKVIDVNRTVTYSDGKTVSGLIYTTLCVRSGDSGGPLFTGSTALGITSGGTGVNETCNSSVSDRRSFYQPVQELLNAYNLKVY